jgi:hypothetical protein
MCLTSFHCEEGTLDRRPLIESHRPGGGEEGVCNGDGVSERVAAALGAARGGLAAGALGVRAAGHGHADGAFEGPS